jgi:hypothetical protein
VKRLIAIAGAMLLTLATPVFAHRLDEYLQAATILVSKDRVQIQLRLAPGVAVLPTVLDSMDTDGNGVISEIEERAYAERVVGDLSLTVDGKRLPLRLVSSRFGSIDELRRGLGENHLELEARLPGGSGSRRLMFENTHRARISVYLVNALAPTDPHVRITAQNRNYSQSWYQLDFVQAAAGTHFVSFATLLRWGVLVCGGLVLLAQLARRRRTSRRVTTTVPPLTAR